MKHVIIPTDFTIRSLQPVHDVMRYYKDQLVRITLLHLVDVPDAIGDLLFRLRRMESRYPVPAAFTQACEMMANKYENQLSGLKPLVQYGTTTAYFENLLEGFGVDTLFMLPEWQPVRAFEDSVDMLPLIRKSNCKVVSATSIKMTRHTDASVISSLLLTGS